MHEHDDGDTDGGHGQGQASLQRGIERRQQELHSASEHIARHAHKLSWRSAALRAVVIVLGSVAAAKGTFDTLLGSDNHWALLSFTLIGILISAAAGIEAAFKLEQRGSALTLLAAQCQSTVRKVDTEWRKNIGSVSDSDLRQVSRQLITMADEMLAKIQEDASKLGVNITLETYALEGGNYRAAVAA